jgi:hypothetical protein
VLSDKVLTPISLVKVEGCVALNILADMSGYMVTRVTSAITGTLPCGLQDKRLVWLPDYYGENYFYFTTQMTNYQPTCCRCFD